jgi:hypothetical protein
MLFGAGPARRGATLALRRRRRVSVQVIEEPPSDCAYTRDLLGQRIRGSSGSWLNWGESESGARVQAGPSPGTWKVMQTTREVA